MAVRALLVFLREVLNGLRSGIKSISYRDSYPKTLCYCREKPEFCRIDEVINICESIVLDITSLSTSRILRRVSRNADPFSYAFSQILL